MSLAALFPDGPLSALSLREILSGLSLSSVATLSSLSSLPFLGFLAAVAIVNYALPRVARPYFLLAASYFFFGFVPETRGLLLVLAGVTLVTWACGWLAGHAQRPALRGGALGLAILACVGLLFLYRYLDPLRQGLADLWGQPAPTLLRLAMPLGLSYFALAALSYPLDVFLGRCEPEPNLFHYALFVSFFPTLITGPIERYPHLRPQLKEPRRFDYDRCAGGAFRMAWGYFKKMVLADNLDLYISLVYAAPKSMDGPQLAAAAVLFAVRLYMDFSGCCDIVLGAARLLGFDLLENFDRPFEAVTFADLWRRWHISLTTWFRDYVYFPLGGSRCALWRALLNTMVVFVVSGLWHGADARYLWWGFFCGLFVALGRLWSSARARSRHGTPTRRFAWLRASARQCVVFAIFCFTFIFFAAATYDFDPLAVLSGLGRGWQGLAGSWKAVGSLMMDSGLDGALPYVLPAGCGVVFALEHYAQDIAAWIRRRNFVVRWALYYALGAAILFWAAFGQSVFIYQQY